MKNEKMKKIILILWVMLSITQANAQNVFGKIVTTQNDTLKVKVITNKTSKIGFAQSIQTKIVVIGEDNLKKEYTPSEIKSIQVKLNNELIEFESVDDILFAELMYNNKLKLLKFIKKGYTSINIYIIKRPNSGKTSYMEAMGLSRLISNKVVLREISDCPVTMNKIETDELKIKGEEGVVSLIKDYEENCY